MEKCRCGFDKSSQESHPCHAEGYSCRKPAEQRFYMPHSNFALAGYQMKASVSETWACDGCWAKFVRLLEKKHETI